MQQQTYQKGSIHIMKQKNFTLKKLLAALGVTLLILTVVLAGSVYAVWHNELSTLASITQLCSRDDAHQDGAVYMMKVKGGFYLDDFVKQGGVKNDAELIDFVTSKLTKGLIDIPIEDPEIACSSFTAQTTDGDRLFGRNYDFSKTNTCIVFTSATKGRHATISTVDLQFLGIDVDSDLHGLMDKITCLAAAYAPLDGINDAGVSCGIYMTYQGGAETVATDQNTDKPDFTSTTLLRLILDYADDVDEAVAIASAYDLHDSAQTSYHYMVADSSGKSAILEWVGRTDASDNDGAQRELKVIYNNDAYTVGDMPAEANYQVITNFILQPDYYADSTVDEMKGYDRYMRLYSELSATGGVAADEQAAMNTLAIVGRRTWDNDDANCCTVHSVVYNLTDRTMLWVPNEHYNDPAYTFEFGFDD